MRNLDQVRMRSMIAVVLTARRSAQNARHHAGALSDTLQVGMQPPSHCEIEDEEGPLNGRQRPKATAWVVLAGAGVAGAMLVTSYVPGVFMSNSMLKRPASLRGLLSPQSPSIEPPPVAP